MTAQSPPWENRLLSMAYEALTHHHAEGIQTEKIAPQAREEVLEFAYRRAEAITKAHSRTFYLASALLPVEKRRAIRALYAFCRVSDDLVDGDPNASQSALESWREIALGDHADEIDLVALAWADTRHRYQIPLKLGEQLIDGIAEDLSPANYETFEDLSAYCYRVASTVGLMAMHIIGFRGKQAIPYAIKLGVALQLTNILRDVGEDWVAGRLYLPREELAEFGLTPEDIGAGVTDERWSAFLQFQIARNRQLYAEAMPGIAYLNPEGRFAIAAAAELYQAILEDICAHEGDIFNRRAHISLVGKLRRLPGIWWRSRFGYPARDVERAFVSLPKSGKLGCKGL